MGANASRQQGYGYGYGYGPPPPPAGYGGMYGAGGMYPPMVPPYGASRRRGKYPQYYAPPVGYPGGVVPMAAYPAMYPQAVAQPQMFYPYITQPMQQISGRPILSQGQGGMQPGFAPQNAVQPGFTQQNNVQSGVSQPAVQMPEPQVQPENVPQNAPGLPGPMPMFTPNVGGPPPGPMPGGGGQQTMQMPEPEVPVSGPPMGPSFDERPVIPGQPGAEFGNAPPPNGMPMPGSMPGSGPMPGLMRGPTPGPMQGPGPGHVPMPEPNTGPQPGGFTSPPDGDYPSSTTASDPLDRNPLPTPPREVAIPEHLLSGSAMTQRSVRMPVPASEDLPPLRNPLPELPKDVYDSRRYRDLAVGSAAQYQNPRKVYPDGWFDRGEGGARHLGRTLTGTFAKLNPFRPHQGRPGLHRRFNTMPVPSVPGAPGMGPEGEFSTETDDMDASSEEDAPNGTLPMSGSMRQPFRRRMPFRFGRNHQQEPPSGFMTMQQLPGGGGIGPQPMHPFSPNGRGTPPPPIRFDRSHPEFAGFSLVSPHRILYKGKLYPTALHLLEAHKFGIKSGIAERIRLTENIGEMRDYTEEQQHNARRDWEVILRDKLEDVLRSKFIQHRRLREILLDTGIAELIFTEPDLFWGQGPNGEGQNELGKALMRVRERLRQEGAGLRF